LSSTDERTGDGTATGQMSSTADGSAMLVVMRRGAVRCHRLPARGEVTIGRSRSVEVSIDATSVSRRHARLTLGAEIVLRDLDSSNGTRVAGVALEPGELRALRPNDVIEIGDVTILFRGPAARARSSRLVSHTHFEALLDGACARGRQTNQRFAIARVRVAPDDERSLERIATGAVRPNDPIAVYGPGELELLLDGAGRVQAEEIVERIRAAADTAGHECETGLACFPTDGLSPEQLMSRAGERPGAPSAADSEIVVGDPSMRQLHEIAKLAASGDLSVLLLGETGVGKEVFARRIHAQSARRNKPFVGLCCAAFSETLLESEVFGHEKGAFTGADRAKPGLLETGEGGTVLLDEIGDLPLSLQAKLLRVLEEREVMRVGGVRAKSIDVRFIAATNRDLQSDIAAGLFRADLYYRLNGMTIAIPPLRDRPTEIGPLARAFAALAMTKLGRRGAIAIASDALAVLEAYPWPGNVRELRNAIERAVLLTPGDEIHAGSLPLDRLGADDNAATGEFDDSMTLRTHRVDVGVPEPGKHSDLHAGVKSYERQRILDALASCDGNQTRAAKLLGISRTTLAARMDAFDLPRPRKHRRDRD
jgi:transcriptional regulator with GAF, ATPase, and Fis domain